MLPNVSGANKSYRREKNELLIFPQYTGEAHTS